MDGSSTHRCFVVPPHILEAVELRGDSRQRAMATEMREEDARIRVERAASTAPTAFLPAPATTTVEAPPNRVYDAQHGRDLPGRLIRDGDQPSGDAAVDHAWVHAADTDRLYRQVLHRNSLDGHGMPMVSTVHFGRNYNNAFWNGQQMVYGDGDGVLLTGFAVSRSVVGHEFGHGVVQFSGGLVYRDQSGALNEHIADTLGVLVDQYARGQQAHEASWLVGAEVLAPGVSGQALRSMAAPGLAYDDDVLGTDPQPYHMDGFVVTSADHGGVHLNSGIPNHAFYLLANYLGGYAWERAGLVWYDALQGLRNPHATFADWADATVAAAAGRFGAGSREVRFTRRAWHLVGVTP